MTEPEEIDTLSKDTRFTEALPTAVRWSHALLAPRLRAGDTVVDATAGNGHDTVFLAQHVLPGGRVFAFDVQTGALEQTRQRITHHASHITHHQDINLIHAGHEALDQHLPVELKGSIRAFMFNLGWLPGSDKSCITRTGTTLTALGTAIEWLTDGGLITVVCYPGHDGGEAEAMAVDAWAGKLPAESFEAQKIAFLNFDGAPPVCVVVRKRARLKARTSD